LISQAHLSEPLRPSVSNDLEMHRISTTSFTTAGACVHRYFAINTNFSPVERGIKRFGDASNIYSGTSSQTPPGCCSKNAFARSNPCASKPSRQTSSQSEVESLRALDQAGRRMLSNPYISLLNRENG
jgi:hypothetical protein